MLKKQLPLSSARLDDPLQATLRARRSQNSSGPVIASFLRVVTGSDLQCHILCIHNQQWPAMIWHLLTSSKSSMDDSQSDADHTREYESGVCDSLWTQQSLWGNCWVCKTLQVCCAARWWHCKSQPYSLQATHSDLPLAADVLLLWCCPALMSLQCAFSKSVPTPKHPQTHVKFLLRNIESCLLVEKEPVMIVDIVCLKTWQVCL